jgi:hypothetical protein
MYLIYDIHQIHQSFNESKKTNIYIRCINHSIILKNKFVLIITTKGSKRPWLKIGRSRSSNYDMQIYYADITNYHTHIKLATHTTKPHSTKGVARV